MNFSAIESICQQYGIAPAKSRGQNFLIDEDILDKIIESANLSVKDTVLEVGPGLGILTGQLINRAGQVVAVELDNKLADYLEKEFKSCRNLKIIRGDILKTDLRRLLPQNYKIVANLPYNITAKFLRNFLAADWRPKEMVLMVQKEVAERIIAKPGRMSKLAVMAQFYGEAEILFLVGKKSFWPEPAVDSAVIRIRSHQKLPPVDIKRFFQIMRMGFSAKRKQLKKNLAGGLQKDKEVIGKLLMDLGKDEKVRAQDLAVADWIKITKEIK